MPRAKRVLDTGPIDPAPELLRPTVLAFVPDADAYPSEDAARAEAHDRWVRACTAHNSRENANQTPMLLDYRYASPRSLPWSVNDGGGHPMYPAGRPRTRPRGGD